MNIAFVVNNVNFKNNIVLGAYAINEVETFDTWVDGNGRTHKANIKKKLSGTFDMAFKTTAEYESFVSAINAVKNLDGSLPVVASANNTLENRLGVVNLSFAPKRTLGADGNDRVERFVVTLEEL